MTRETPGNPVFDRPAIMGTERVGPCAPHNRGCECLRPSDSVLRYVGLSETQIETLHDFCERNDFTLEETNELRLRVHDEAVRLLMTRRSGEDDLRDDLGLTTL